MKYPQIILVGCVVVGALIGYFLAQMTPTHDPDKKTASILILSCIDFRFAETLGWYLTHQSRLHDDYDLFSLAGASLGALQTDYPGWQSAFFDHIGLAIQLHDIKEIWVFDHMDCGMYKATLKLEKDEDKSLHVKKLTELKTLLKSKYPQLGYRGHILELGGGVEVVV